MAVIVVFVAAVIGAIYFYTRADEYIRATIEQQLAQQYPSHRVAVRRAQRLSDRQIALRGVVISQHDGGRRFKPVVSVDEVLVKCNTGWDDLIQARFSIKRITLRGLSVHIEQRPDGSFNVADLFPLPRLGHFRPILSVENGNLEFVDRSRLSARTFSLNGIALQITGISSQPPGRGAENWLEIRGEATGNVLQRAEFTTRINEETGAWSAEGKLDRLVISPELRDALPEEWGRHLRHLGSLRCRANLAFKLNSTGPSPTASGGNDSRVSPHMKQVKAHSVVSSQEPPIRFDVSGAITEGHWVDDRFPLSLSNATAKIHCDNNTATIDNLRARWGRTKIRASARFAGFDAHSPIAVHVAADSMHLTDLYQYENLLRALPASIQQEWNKFSPRGLVNMKLHLGYNGKTWTPDIAVECLNVSLTCPKYRYRLHQSKGLLRWKNDQLDMDLTALASGQMVRLNGRIHHPGPQGFGTIDFRSEDPIPINKALYEALDEKARKIVRSLHPSGSFMFRLQRQRNGPSDNWHQHLILNLERCSVQYEKFAYPLDNVRGILDMRDGEWTFRDLKGQNDSGRVTGDGSWRKTSLGGVLKLQFQCSNIPLEDELRDSLSSTRRKLWYDLRPRGTLDHVSVRIVRHTGQSASVQVTVDKLPPAQDVAERTISIRPVWFPYRLDELTGQMDYHDGSIKLHNIRARHGAVRIATHGLCRLNNSGPWQCQLTELTVDRLALDREFVTALPSRLRDAVVALNPQGLVAVRGKLNFHGGAGAPLESQWDLRVDMAGSQIQRGVQLEHLFGGVRFVGGHDGHQFHTQGEFDIDSLMYHGVHFTQVQGPFSIDNARLLLGSWSQHTQPGQLPRHLTAQVFGGTLYGDGHFPIETNEGHNSSRQDKRPAFEINASFADGDLAQIGLLNAVHGKAITGKALARLRLRGTGTGLHTLRGSGTIRLRDADIYELPLMVSLLNIVSIRPPDRTAFTTSDVLFRINGEHIYFDPIEFHGDVLSLKGNGHMNFAGDLDVKFYTKVGRESLNIPVFRPLLREARPKFMEIHVTGPVDNPKTTRQAFPGLNDTLQQLFPEEARRKEMQVQRNPRLRNAFGRNRSKRRWR